MIRSPHALRMNYLAEQGVVHRVCHGARQRALCLPAPRSGPFAAFDARPQLPRTASNSWGIPHRVGDFPRRNAMPAPTPSGSRTPSACGANDPKSQCPCEPIQSLSCSAARNSKARLAIGGPFANHTRAGNPQHPVRGGEPALRGVALRPRNARATPPGTWLAASELVRTSFVPVYRILPRLPRLHVRHPRITAAASPA